LFFKTSGEVTYDKTRYLPAEKSLTGIVEVFMKKIAVVLAGCGHMDGSEIQESVSTLLAISKLKAEYTCFSPMTAQTDMINHLTGQQEEATEPRNLLVEAARISRGNIVEIKELKSEDFDALIFPGGFGVAKNLFTYAFDGREAKIDDQVKRVILDFHNNGKYIGQYRSL